MMLVKILAFAGSARKDSYNKKLARVAASAAEAAGAQVTYLDMADYVLPLYDQDLETAQGLPENAKKLKQLFKDHDGLIISSAEYNSSITPLLKNVFDWVSRQETGESSLAAYKNKTAVLFSASPGALGGLRALVHVRAILGSIGVLMLPDQLAVGKAHEAFDENGMLKDKKQQESVEKLTKQLVETITKLKS